MKKEKPPKRDLTGKRFTDWYVESFAGRSKNCTVQYNAKCKCGKRTLVLGSDLESGKSKRCKSCGMKYRYRKNPNTAVGSKSPGWRGYKDIPRAIFTKVKYGASKRDLPFKVTIEDLQNLWEAQKERCAYTGRVLFFNNKSFSIKNKKGKMFDFASLDRIDSNKGYIKGNIQWVAQAVNVAKHAHKDEDFLNLVKDIYENKNLGSK